MHQTAKPVVPLPAEPSETTTGNQPAGAGPTAQEPQDQMQQSQAKLANAQFAALQAVIGKFSDAQLSAALVHVADHRLAGLLARRLMPAATASAQSVQPVEHVQAQMSEQRAGDRTKVLRSGKIIYNNKMSVADCKIRDISRTGCRITSESTAGIPKNFTLHIVNGDTRHECEVAWRSSSEMGVKFIG